mmetsp:Transcript_39263/g.34938  ORF Transcript_39263/g.34938 Transcript_39263/m.34938 type:complete len:205 (-) Transcript_39263:922-1536(-)
METETLDKNRDNVLGVGEVESSLEDLFTSYSLHFGHETSYVVVGEVELEVVDAIYVDVFEEWIVVFYDEHLDLILFFLLHMKRRVDCCGFPEYSLEIVVVLWVKHFELAFLIIVHNLLSIVHVTIKNLICIRIFILIEHILIILIEVQLIMMLDLNLRNSLLNTIHIPKSVESGSIMSLEFGSEILLALDIVLNNHSLLIPAMD